MLFLKDAGGKGLDRIVIQYAHDGLANDRAGIEALLDEMHRAAGNLYPVFQRLMLGIQTWKRGQP